MASEAVYIIDMSRTPFIKAEKGPGHFSAADLAVAACAPMLLRQNFLASDIGEVIAGCMIPSSEEANIARIIALRLGCGHSVPAYTVQRNCASGMQAIDSGMKDIQLKRHDLVLAGGTESMSRAPLLFNAQMTKWVSQFAFSKGWQKKLSTLFAFRPSFLKPEIALLKGLTDHRIRMSMGQTAEEVAFRYNISREQMDEYALQSHIRAIHAQNNNQLSDIVPMIDPISNNMIEKDNGLRFDASIEKLSKLKPFFDKPFGAVTAGNSSQITDGAAFLLLASEEAVQRYQLKPRAKIVDMAWVGVEPETMGLGPVVAIQQILKQQGRDIKEIDYWEINEAFAAQVLGCLSALNSSIEMKTLNPYGGAISLGHPVGASGARIIMSLINALENNHAKRGIASLCIGGGQGGAMLIERIGEA